MQAFQADGRVRGLSSDDSNLQADFELGGDLRAFQTEYPNGQASALIRYDARLVRTDDKRVVASRRFEVSQPVDGKGRGGGQRLRQGRRYAVGPGSRLDPAPGLGATRRAALKRPAWPGD